MTALPKRIKAADRRMLDARFDAARITKQDLAEVKAWPQNARQVVNQSVPTDIADRAGFLSRAAKSPRRRHDIRRPRGHRIPALH